MVGVPRSQGCRQCRRRKKGCDLERPTCGQCARLNVPCAYDERRFTFVSHDAPEAGSSRLTSRRSGAQPTRSSSNTPPLASGSQSQSLVRSAFEQQIIGEFWTEFLPKDDIRSRSLAYLDAAPWVEVAQSLATQDTTVRFALDAVAFASLGRIRLDENLQERGIELYGRALRETNRGLQQPTRAQSDGLLAACRLLGLYEQFRLDKTSGITSQGGDWQRHVAGTCKIVELRGREAHREAHGRALHQDVHSAAITSAISLRSPNLFNGTSWNTVPWESGDLRDHLGDIMNRFPGLLQEFDRLKGPGRVSPDSGGLLDLLHRCLAISDNMQIWENSAIAATLRSAEEADELTGPRLVTDELQTLLETFNQHGYGFAFIVFRFWAACIILYSTTMLVHQSLAEGRSASQLPLIPAWVNPRPFATNISRCVSHFFRPEAGLYGAQMAAFPIGCALHFYAATGMRESEEYQQVCSMFRQTRLGGVPGDFLRSIADNAASQDAKGDCTNGDEHVNMASKWFGSSNTAV